MCRNTRWVCALPFLCILHCVAEEPRAATESKTAVQERLDVCDAFFNKLSRRVSFEFNDTPLQEALTFLHTLTRCSVILDPDAAKAGAAQTNITIKFTNGSMATALDEILAKAGLAWTIGAFPGLAAQGSDKLAMLVSTPQAIKAMNEKYPEVAKAVADFRERMRAQVRVQQAQPNGDEKDGKK
jgi:hypothetical protein